MKYCGSIYGPEAFVSERDLWPYDLTIVEISYLVGC
jgi:hypothetical protein